MVNLWHQTSNTIVRSSMASTLCLPHLRQTSLLWWLMDDNGMFMDLVLATIGDFGLCFKILSHVFVLQLIYHYMNKMRRIKKRSPVSWGWFTISVMSHCEVTVGRCWSAISAMLVVSLCSRGVFCHLIHMAQDAQGWSLFSGFYGAICVGSHQRENCRFWSGEVADPDWLWHLWEHHLFQLTNLLITDAQVATTRHHEDQQKRLNHGLRSPPCWNEKKLACSEFSFQFHPEPLGHEVT